MTTRIYKHKPFTEEHKRKISKSHIGIRPSEESKLKNRLAHLGKKHSEETKIKISLNHRRHQTKETRKKISKSHIGIKQTEESRRKISLAKKGKKLSKEHRKNIGIGNIGRVSAMKGKENKWGRHTEETIEKIKEKRAKQILPIKDTSIEIKIQNFLKQLGIDFFTHQYMKEIEHSYQCDILIPSMNLVIECDGDYWHKYPTGTEIDYVRTSELIKKGFKVLRLWENEIRVMELKDFQNKIGEI